TCHESENIWITWFAECWAWSLYVEPPEEDLPKEIYWLFPGWCPVDLGQMPSILGSFYLGTLDDEPFRRMLQMIPDVLKCAVNQDLPETLPDLFLLALLIDENRNFSDLQPAHIEAVIRSQWVRPYIVTNLSEGKRSDLAKAVWKWVIDGEGQTFSPEDLFNLDQPFFEFILENLPRDDFMLGLKEPFSAVLLRLFKHLPQKHREPLVRWLLEKTPERIEQWINTQTMEAMGPDQVPLLELLIQSEIGASWMLIRRLWQVDPDRAFEKAQEAFETDQDAGHWFAEAVPRYLSHLLKIVEAAPRADVPEWLTRWLSQRLTRYSTVADQAYVLLNKIRNTD
ncbi:MAG: hypothetical protein QF675_11985, partial [SAR324 cluster bacterium]|nr:hypothetical protein [SAR324 cluster bacterium]